MRSPYQSRRFFSASAIAALGAAGAAAQTIHNLGTHPGGTNSFGSAVNADGSVAVGTGNTPSGFNIAFRYVIPGGFQSLGTIGTGRYSYAYAVSDDGEVVAGHSETSALRDRAFRWTAGGGMIDMGTLPGGFSSLAKGISADGNRLAGWSDFDCCSGPRPARWTFGGGIDNCGVLSTGFPQYAQGEAISADGTTVVGYSNSNSNPTGRRAARWTQAGGLVDLGTLGGLHATASAVSGDGSFIAGNSHTPTAIHAARWYGGGVEDLGVLPGDVASYATAMTRDGIAILGNSQGADTEPFLWTETFGIESLTTYVAAEGVNLTGWILDEVYGVSADGRAIVGNGRFNGQFRGFLIRGLKPICGPRIAFQSPDQIGCIGGNVILVVGAISPSQLFPSFQWQRLNPADGEWFDLSETTTVWGTTYSGVYSSQLTISNCAIQDAPGNYRCVVYAGCAPRGSAPINVSLNTIAPFFASQPVDVETCPGQSAAFSAGPFSNQGAPYSFQWERETAPNSGVYVPLFNGAAYSWDGNVAGFGAIVSGAQTGLLLIAPDTANARILGPAHSRGYRCVASNACGVAVSDGAFIKAFTSCTNADANCDNVVSVGDISAFVLALTNIAQYEINYPDCNPDNVDVNDDNVISVGDIAPFVALLTGG